MHMLATYFVVSFLGACFGWLLALLFILFKEAPKPPPPNQYIDPRTIVPPQ